ncbi:4516_t:CDS:2 [Paraglomus brasilianum]|uniref:4516_t:CDS:1 n=1 Tax=Paraglomus brasilianum TaxID=144538 RepID=A0A9N9CZ12_9GLOM|nr:4516_t:CDS:2 [Paraglomus brasilianum]
MVLKFGYAVDEQLGSLSTTNARIVTPMKVPERITLSVVNSSRFVVMGTKPEILEWIRSYPRTVVDVILYEDQSIAPHIHVPDVVLDLILPSSPEVQARYSWMDYINPLHHPDPTEIPIRLEFRPVQEKVDKTMEPLLRLVVKRESKFCDIVDNLQNRWDKISYPSTWDGVKKVAGLPSAVMHEEEEEAEVQEANATVGVNAKSNVNDDVHLENVVVDDNQQTKAVVREYS